MRCHMGGRVAGGGEARNASAGNLRSGEVGGLVGAAGEAGGRA